jgi:L-ascorbate metabolism protein UlaG (beta-lactamase superfamily)
MKLRLVILLIFSGLVINSFAFGEIPEDIIKTKDGDLKIFHVGHGSLWFEFKGIVIHVDPFSRIADYDKFPKADLVLITHDHGDHFDPALLNSLSREGTVIVYTQKCHSKKEFKNALVMGNGEQKVIKGIGVEAVPAYNLVHKRKNGSPYHQKGEGNGYILVFSNKKVYIGGDTEYIPEMKNLKDIDVAFLPVNLPYTMTPEMACKAVSVIKPGIFYPYHFAFGKSDLKGLRELFKKRPGVELRIRNQK